MFNRVTGSLTWTVTAFAPSVKEPPAIAIFAVVSFRETRRKSGRALESPDVAWGKSSPGATDTSLPLTEKVAVAGVLSAEEPELDSCDDESLEPLEPLEPLTSVLEPLEPLEPLAPVP